MKFEYFAKYIATNELAKDGDRAVDPDRDDQVFLMRNKDRYVRKDYKKAVLFLCVGPHDRPRVVGRISPGATWVQQGDRFREEDIKEIIDLSNKNREVIYSIRNFSCGHFH